MASTVDDDEDLVSGDTDPIMVNGTNDMICALCFQGGAGRNWALGICKDCKFYLCGDCISAHIKDERLRIHRVAYFYCAQKLRVNKYVRATSFCLDCGQYLCHKCVMDHAGYRSYRNHTFIGDKDRPPPDLERQGTDRRTLLTRNSLRRPGTRGTQSTEGSNKSANIKRENPKSENKRQSVNIEETERPRKLLQSTTGRRPQIDNPRVIRPRPQHQENKPRNVHYEEAVKPAHLLGEYGVKSPDDKNVCRVISSVFLSNGYVVVADAGNFKVKLFDNRFKFLSSMFLEDFPVALCVSDTNQVEFFASSGSNIFKIGFEKGLETKDTIKTDIPSIEGITPWSNGIAAIFRSAKSKFDRKGHWEIHLITTSGEVKYEINISSPNVVKLVTPIWYVATVKGGNHILISDTLNNRIVCIDLINWHVVYVLKGKGAEGAPRSLVVDSNDNILVTWYDEIHFISQTANDLGAPVTKVDKNSVIALNKTTKQLLVYRAAKGISDKFSIYSLN